MSEPRTSAITFDRGWVVWYLHWRFRSSTTEIEQCDDQDEAFSTALYLEDEADDCVNEVIGIESPSGEFIDLAVYRAAKVGIAARRRQHEEEDRANYRDEEKFRITISGPVLITFTPRLWTDKYVEQ
jgi:hypothetical protein